LVDLFGVTRERMHLIALALAHVEPPSSFETASLLVRGSTRAVLQAVLGRWPVGIKRALKHLPPQVVQRQNYHRLVDLLDDADSAKVLHHAAKIDDLALQVLTELPPSLRRPLPLALSDWPRKLNGFPSVVVWKEWWMQYITFWNTISFGKLVDTFHYLHYFGKWKEMAQKLRRSYFEFEPVIASTPQSTQQISESGPVRKPDDTFFSTVVVSASSEFSFSCQAAVPVRPLSGACQHGNELIRLCHAVCSRGEC
jgi:hypothetical protein